MNDKIYLGDDKGAGANKLFGAHGGIQVPSRVAISDGRGLGRMEGMKLARPPLEIQTSDGDFYVGATAHDWGRPVENLDHSRLTGTPEMVALTYASWTQYMRASGDFTGQLVVFAGLPVEALEGGGARRIASEAKGWMLGRHSWLADGQELCAVVDDVKVTSQATGALFDHLLDDQGAFDPTGKSLLKDEVGIVSVGFNTIEMMVMSEKAPVPRLTKGVTVGVRRLLEIVNRGGHYSLGELDSRLRSGALDISSALKVWEREVIGEIEKLWGKQWRRFARVLLVGGGVVLLKKSLPYHFDGKAFVPDAPVMAISRGLYKMAAAAGRG